MSMNEHEPMEFVLEQAEIPVTLKDPKTGEVIHCIMRELDGRQRDAYLNSLARRMKTGKGGQVRDFSGLYANLISRCLIDRETREPRFKEDQIQAFPSSVQSALFKKAQEISGLGDDDAAEAEAKND